MRSEAQSGRPWTGSIILPHSSRGTFDGSRYCSLVRLFAFLYSRSGEVGSPENPNCICEQNDRRTLYPTGCMKIRSKQSSPRSEVSSLESAVSISGSSAQGGSQNGRSKSTQLPALSLVTDFPMPKDLKTSGIAARRTFQGLIASLPVSRAKTSARQEVARPAWAFPGREAGSSARQFVSSPNYNPAGWSLKTSRHCSIRRIAETFKQSSHRLPTAGMWDSGECWMLSISEAPADVVGFSWSRVLDATPHSSLWLTPRQWRQYLARLSRNGSHGQRLHGLGILYVPQVPLHRYVSAVSLLLLTRTDGIRWLSGSERLKIMGFASDWMRPTLRRLGVPEMPLPLRSRNGSARSSSAVNPQPSEGE